MSELIKYELPYREMGEKKILSLNIDFISKGAINDFNEIILSSSMVQKDWDRMSENNILIETLKNEKPENFKSQISKLEEENKESIKNLMEYNDNGFFEKRLNLIKKIFIQNGITDEKFLSKDFWDECVDTQEIMKFLTSVIYKDLSEKKK